MVSIRVPDIFPCNVRNYGISNLPCGKRGRKSSGSNQAVLDVPRSVGMDIFGKYIPGLGGAVWLRLLQRDAHIAANRPYCYDFL